MFALKETLMVQWGFHNFDLEDIHKWTVAKTIHNLWVRVDMKCERVESFYYVIPGSFIQLQIILDKIFIAELIYY